MFAHQSAGRHSRQGAESRVPAMESRQRRGREVHRAQESRRRALIERREDHGLAAASVLVIAFDDRRELEAGGRRIGEDDAEQDAAEAFIVENRRKGAAIKIGIDQALAP